MPFGSIPLLRSSRSGDQSGVHHDADGTRTKHVICTVCDIGCQLRPVAKDGVLTKVLAHENPFLANNICFKGTAAPRIHNHPDRLKVPLKRAGPRGADQWEEISYAQALDEIAKRLSSLVQRYGPETLAVSTSGWNTAVTHGADRRFMNLLGSPNWISGVALCAGNTAAVNKLTYGWYPFPDLLNTKCIVLLGHNPRRQSWAPIYHMINDARAHGAKLIVADPRVSDQAETADIHLRLRAGTDAALLLGFLAVIIDEKLYDAQFVRDWTVGWEELKARVGEYPLERVEAITGVDRQQIAAAARMYATARGAVIPWTPITDQQLSSTSAIRLQSILRAITGNIDVPGGETFSGLNPDYISDSQMSMHELLTQQQRDKQLGSDLHPVYTYRAQDMLGDYCEKVWGYRHIDLVMGCFMANPSAVFRAMATEKPYPVKAFFALGNNALLSYPNQNQIYQGMMNQDLIVVHEIFQTPTSMLADYVLPGDVFSERNNIHDFWNWVGRLTVSEKVVEPPQQASNTYQFWRDLAIRMGFGEHFPWQTIEDVLDYRLSPSGMTFQQFADKHYMKADVPVFKKYEKTGFATPSGKVELWSSILDELGFDPLPYFREAPPPDADYPYLIFTGVREDPFFQTGQRNIDVLRNRARAPKLFLHPVDAAREGLADGDWARLETGYGAVVAQVLVQESMKEGHIRVPHGWWYPELRGKEHLAGAFLSSDAVLCGDDPELLDHEQGIPHFKGFPGRIVKLTEAPEFSAAARGG